MHFSKKTSTLMSLKRISKKDSIQIDSQITINFDINDKILIPETPKSKAARNQDKEKTIYKKASNVENANKVHH